MKWQLMSALASLERFGEKDTFFKKWRSCRRCLQSEKPLGVFSKIEEIFLTALAVQIEKLNLKLVIMGIRKWIQFLKSVNQNIQIVKARKVQNNYEFWPDFCLPWAKEIETAKDLYQVRETLKSFFLTHIQLCVTMI